MSSADASQPPLVRNAAFFLDIDGTLFDIVALPAAVHAGAADFELLTALYEAAGGVVALVSGRPIAGIDKIFAPLKLPAAGQHGVERRDARGRIHRHAATGDAWRAAIAPLKRFAAQHEDDGIIFEVESRRNHSVLKAKADIAELLVDRVDGAQIGKKVLQVALA